jgi:DNA-binding transcriptional ArsR family regulator
MQAALQAIVEPRRREILRLIKDREMTSGTIASHFEVTGPAVSQHLTVLRNAGLVSERREGTRRIYRARLEALAGLRAFLDEFWDERLDGLKLEAEADERRRRGSRQLRS